jgi:outer membrane protein TolC
MFRFPPHLSICAVILLSAIFFDIGASRAESLPDAWNAGLTVDQQLEASRWASSAAQRGLYAARAERLPSIDANATYYTMDKPIGIAAAVPVLGTLSLDILQREGLIAGAHVSQPLYTFGRIQSGIDAAGAEVTAAVSDEAKSELDVLLRVSTGYTNVLLAQRGVEVAGQSVQSLEGHVRDVTNRVQEGVGILNDQLAAEVSLSNARQQLLQANARLDIARAAFNRSVGRPLDTAVQLDEVAEPTGAYDLEHMTHMALVTRPEIAALSAATRALRSRADGIRAGCKPQFAVRGGVDYIENRYFRDQTYSSVMVTGMWNLFDSGRKGHTAAKLEQAGEALLRKRNDIETVIQLQVRDAWRELETNRERVRVNRAALKSADENLHVAKNRYDEGAGTNTEVLDAETLRTATYSNYYRSLYESVQSLMKLSRAVGDFGLAVADVQPTAAPVDEVPPPTVPQP